MGQLVAFAFWVLFFVILFRFVYENVLKPLMQKELNGETSKEHGIEGHRTSRYSSYDHQRYTISSTHCPSGSASF